ncbi:MAG TPA: competence type IV pilus minor pilin ComGD [Chondromyces sp.]|nr:competence type IV pilus minor pilin ComGD [Chondromyces sp.]
MAHRRKKEDGYTLLEILLVLTVLVVLLGVAVIPLPKLGQEMDKRIFIAQLHNDLQFAHAKAMAEQQKVQVNFHTNQKYVIKTLSAVSSETITRSFPQSVRYLEGTMNSIVFLPNGNTDRFGTMTFIVEKEVIKVVFLIGKGRFYVKEE